MPKKVYVAGQEVLFLTQLFGKAYYWMKDRDGTIYLVGVDEEGRPKFA